MQKQTGAILLVAGTCIGSGMIALPMSFARIGILPSAILMMLMWGIIYYSAILNLELNLQAGKPLYLGPMAQKFSGKKAQLLGLLSFKILSFALVAVYIYASSSLLQKMLSSAYNYEKFNFNTIASIFSFLSIILLSLPIKLVDYVNRLLFSCLLAIIFLLIMGLVVKINWSNVPMLGSGLSDIKAWIYIAPIAFTAFGFHGSLPTIINYCNNDQKILKKVFLWGCFIPSLIYIIWTISVLAVTYNENAFLYQKMLIGKVEVGELIEALIGIIESKFARNLIWWISLLAILTSLLGVGMSLCESIKKSLSAYVANKILLAIFSALITVIPGLIMTIWIPNAFLKVLGFAGMILVIIAILLPLYLFYNLKPKHIFCREMRYPFLRNLLGILGLWIMLCELFGTYFMFD